MSKLFYRFRSVEKLIGKHKELESQTIYFAPSEDLNDPMEGYQDFFWKGDTIIWENFFRHYIFCLGYVSYQCIHSDSSYELEENDIPVERGISLYEKPLKDIVTEMQNTLIKDKEVSNLIQHIQKRESLVRRNELIYYLQSIHQLSLKIIFDGFEKNRILKKSPFLCKNPHHELEKINSGMLLRLATMGATSKEEEKQFIEEFFFVHQNKKKQLSLRDKHLNISQINSHNELFILERFTEIYLKRLCITNYPKWYTSCFMSECKNSSVWAHYGDNHCGTCLIFKSENSGDENFISLYKPSGINSRGITKSWQNMKLHQIDYKKGFGEIDFFKSIGNIPIPVLYEMWYLGKNEEISECATELRESEDRWRKTYWENFIRNATIKTKDWAYENEYRLIAYSGLLQEKENRNLHYNFSSLDGIIFGINTTEKDKLEIMRIILEKCKANKRCNFNFYQSYYSGITHKIEHIKLDLINLMALNTALKETR